MGWMRRSILAVCMLLFCGTVAWATVPARLEYQGYLTDIVGTPIDCQGCLTPYAFKFSLYDDVVGGEAVWTETHSGIDVVSGVFRVELGVYTDLDSELLAGDRWLEIQVNGQAPMVPRQGVVSAPYALRADLAERSLESENAVTLGGQPLETFVQVADTADFITTAELDEILAGLGYTPGDNDTQLTEAQVDAFVANNNFSTGDHTVDTNTHLSEAEVDAFVADNGYVAQADLTAAQAALSELQALVDSIDTSVGVDISGLQTQITALEASLASAMSNLSSLEASLSNEETARQSADDSEAATRGAKDIELENAVTAETMARTADDLVLQGNINTVEADVVALDTSLDPIAKDGLPADLADGDDDTQLSEAQVDAYVANNDYAEIGDTMSSLLCNSGELSRFDGSDWTCTTALVVDASGNVGVGTAEPSETLEVVGGVKVTEVVEAVGGVHLGNPETAPVGTLRWTGTELHINTDVGWQIVVMVLTEPAQCVEDGGDWEASQNVCYFAGTACAEGWTTNGNHSTTLVNSCSHSWGGGGWCTATIGPNCTTGSHTRANVSTESCMYCNDSGHGTQAGCSAVMTERGCSQL